MAIQLLSGILRDVAAAGWRHRGMPPKRAIRQGEVEFLHTRTKDGVCKKYLGFYAVYCGMSFAGPREARQNGKS